MSLSISRDGKAAGLDAEMVRQPETGMGFQVVEAKIYGSPKPLLVFNGEDAIDLSGIAIAVGPKNSRLRSVT